MNPSASSFVLPQDCPGVKIVSSFDELVATRFGDGINALCWPRELAGDFVEVVDQLGRRDDIETLDAASLRALSLSASGKAAVEILIEDHQRLMNLGLSPVLDCIQRYPRDEDGAVVPTDVYSFHADSATVEADTFLCSYTEAASEGLANRDALRCVDVPEMRALLLKDFGGEDDEAFREHLKEYCYDLHYIARPGAQPFSFGLGHFWRIAIEYPGCPVLPCIHRAPTTRPDQRPRLLLIS